MNRALLANGGRLASALRGRSLLNLVGDALSILRARIALGRDVRAGRWIRLWGRMIVSNQGAMTLGDRVRMRGTLTPIELVTGPEGRLEIGDGVYINYGCSISAQEHVRIGANCSIGPYCNILDNPFHRLEPERRGETPPSQPVILEENVWLGTRVIVLPGVTIGKDSVIGAGSVVTRDIPPRSVAAGVPARVIRSL